MYDELVKRLREAVGNRDEKCESCPYTEDYPCCIDCLDKLHRDAADAIIKQQGKIHILKKTAEWLGEKVPRWISVEERPPDTMKDKSSRSGWSEEIAPSDDVLCYLRRENRQTVAWYSHTYAEWTTVDENTVYKYGEVTHWMPLPAPPEVEK